MKSFEGSFNFLHKLCSFDFPTDIYVMHFIFESIHCQYLCNFSVKNKSRAFFGKKCRLKKKSKKKAKGPIVRHKPLEWGLCVTKGCSRNDSGWKNWKRREWADTGFLYLSWSPSVHHSCSVRPLVRFPSAVTVWFWLSPTIQLTNQLIDQIGDPAQNWLKNQVIQVFQYTVSESLVTYWKKIETSSNIFFWVCFA